MGEDNKKERLRETIKSTKDADLISTYKNRGSYNPEIVDLLVEELNVRDYDVTEIDKTPLEQIDVILFKNKTNTELVNIYYKPKKFKQGWSILARNELKKRGIEVEQQTVAKPFVFTDCFSFEGRIKRSEYALSILICYGYAVVVGMFLHFSSFSGDNELLMHILLIPAYWLMFSQGARRCHDMEHNGWCQLIPFYFIEMFFLDGTLGRNKYGENPKGQGNFPH